MRAPIVARPGHGDARSQPCSRPPRGVIIAELAARDLHRDAAMPSCPLKPELTSADGQGVVVNLRIDLEETRLLGVEHHVCELQLLHAALDPPAEPPVRAAPRCVGRTRR